MLVLNEKSDSPIYILTVLEVGIRYRQLGKCSRCKKYNEKCKKLMDDEKNNECNT